MIMQRACRDPGVGGLDGTSLPAGLPGDRRPFGAQFPACGKHDIPGEMLGQLCPSKRRPVALQRPPLQLRKTHKRDAEKAVTNVTSIPVCTGMTLKSIDTTSVSMIAAFIEKRLMPSLRGAMPEAWPRSPRPTHLRPMDAQAWSQTPSPGRPPATLRVPRMRTSRSSA